MKSRSINRIARGLGWTAAVAGTLGLALPASAQAPPPRGYRTAPVVAGPARPQAAPMNAAADPTTLRLVQARVQIAWLADPATFGYTLGLAAGPQGIQVTGFVPNDGVRQRAMQLAMQNSGLPVVDGLKVHPGLTVRCVGRVSGDDLQREAAAILRETFGDRAGKWQLSAGTDGRVTVTGACATPDEQLQVVSSLRRAGHCSCVSNQLSIGELPTAVAMAERFPAPQMPVAVPEPAPIPEPPPTQPPVVAWHPENSVPPVEAPPVVQEAKAEDTPARTETAVSPAPGAPRVAPAGFYESPKIASVDALPAVPGKTDAGTTAPAEAKRAEGEVYETTGEIQWETPPADGKNTVWSSSPDAKPAPATTPTGANAAPADATRVQEVIRARCGADLREVRVEILRDRRMHISLRVAAGVDRGQVETRVRLIPEVANYAHGTYMD